jgi:hypothetical protein
MRFLDIITLLCAFYFTSGLTVLCSGVKCPEHLTIVETSSVCWPKRHHIEAFLDPRVHDVRAKVISTRKCGG